MDKKIQLGIIAALVEGGSGPVHASEREVMEEVKAVIPSDNLSILDEEQEGAEVSTALVNSLESVKEIPKHESGLDSLLLSKEERATLGKPLVKFKKPLTEEDEEEEEFRKFRRAQGWE